MQIWFPNSPSMIMTDVLRQLQGFCWLFWQDHYRLSFSTGGYMFVSVYIWRMFQNPILGKWSTTNISFDLSQHFLAQYATTTYGLKPWRSIQKNWVEPVPVFLLSEFISWMFKIKRPIDHSIVGNAMAHKVASGYIFVFIQNLQFTRTHSRGKSLITLYRKLFWNGTKDLFDYYLPEGKVY